MKGRDLSGVSLIFNLSCRSCRSVFRSFSLVRSFVRSFVRAYVRARVRRRAVSSRSDGTGVR